MKPPTPAGEAVELERWEMRPGKEGELGHQHSEVKRWREDGQDRVGMWKDKGEWREDLG